MELPSEQELEDEVLEHGPEEYAQELRSSTMYKGFGSIAVSLYLGGGGRLKNLKESYRLGGLIGLNLRVVDDILDGDGCEAVDKRRDFMDNYIQSIKTGEAAPPVQREVESVAYRAGSALNQSITDPVTLDDITLQFQDMRDMVEEEDKSEPDEYLEYVNVGGGMAGSSIALILDDLPGYRADTRNVELAFDVGFAGQICDDMMEEDITLEERKLEKFRRKSMERLREHDRTLASVLPAVADLYSNSYRFIESYQRLKESLLDRQ